MAGAGGSGGAKGGKGGLGMHWARIKHAFAAVVTGWVGRWLLDGWVTGEKQLGGGR